MCAHERQYGGKRKESPGAKLPSPLQWKFYVSFHQIFSSYIHLISMTTGHNYITLWKLFTSFQIPASAHIVTSVKFKHRNRSYLLAHRFLCFSSIFVCFSYSYVRQTKLASSLVNFWAHDKIVFDLIFL